MALRAISLETSLEVLSSVLFLVVVNPETRCQLRRLSRQEPSIQRLCVRMVTAQVQFDSFGMPSQLIGGFLLRNPSSRSLEDWLDLRIWPSDDNFGCPMEMRWVSSGRKLSGQSSQCWHARVWF